MPVSDQYLLQTAQSWLNCEKQISIATVIETWGSAPQPVGSQLLIDADGNFEGSVSGGCVEVAVIIEAVDVIASGIPKLVEFGVEDEIGFQAGLSCGGRIRIYIEPVGMF
ncbi:MAG: hypothetical protein TECD_00008 [Hyphomicrobiaceae bacterium hypho_1]